MFHMVNLSKSPILIGCKKNVFKRNLLLRNHLVDEAVSFHTCEWHYPLHKLCFWFRPGNNSGCYGTFYIVVDIPGQ